MQYENTNTNSMDNQSVNNTIHSPVDDVPKAPKSNNTFKLATIALAIVTLVLGGILTFTIINNNKTTTQANAKLKETEAKVSASEEVIKKYEEATKTKVEEVKNETKEIVKQIVMPTTYDVKFEELHDTLFKNGKLIAGGKFYTDDNGKYLVADLSILGFSDGKDQNGNEVSIMSRSGYPSVWYREIPNGSWVLAYEGNGVPLCKDFVNIKEIYEKKGALGSFECQ